MQSKRVYFVFTNEPLWGFWLHQVISFQIIGDVDDASWLVIVRPA